MFPPFYKYLRVKKKNFSEKRKKKKKRNFSKYSKCTLPRVGCAARVGCALALCVGCVVFVVGLCTLVVVWFFGILF